MMDWKGILCYIVPSKFKYLVFYYKILWMLLVDEDRLVLIFLEKTAFTPVIEYQLSYTKWCQLVTSEEATHQSWLPMQILMFFPAFSPPRKENHEQMSISLISRLGKWLVSTAWRAQRNRIGWKKPDHPELKLTGIHLRIGRHCKATEICCVCMCVHVHTCTRGGT